MESYLQNLPPYIGQEIFKFLIPESSRIEFRRHKDRKHQIDTYSHKYTIAHINEQIITNNRGLYLSRIYKKNGKHRYYITENMIDEIEVERGDQTVNIYCYDYHSKYVGKNIDYALFALLL